jgi:hypothetical protein
MQRKHFYRNMHAYSRVGCGAWPNGGPYCKNQNVYEGPFMVCLLRSLYQLISFISVLVMLLSLMIAR